MRSNWFSDDRDIAFANSGVKFVVLNLITVSSFLAY